MSQANAFRVIDVFEVPGRSESLVVMDVIKGSLSTFHSTLTSLEEEGEWQISSMPMVEPIEMSAGSEGKRIAVGIQGSMKLRPGMILIAD